MRTEPADGDQLAERPSLFVTCAGQFERAQRPSVFVVFGGQRSGSTLVATRLDSHPRIVCHEEVLLPAVDSEPSLSQWLVAHGHPRWFRVRPSIRETFLDSVAEADPGPGIDVVGMKIMYDQLSIWPKLSYVFPFAGRACHDGRLIRWLSNNRVLIVHTLRRNHLKMLTSHTLAARAGHFHSRNHSGTAAIAKVDLPLRGLTMRLERIASAEKVARSAIQGLPTIEVWYEDYVGPRCREIEDQLCAAVGQHVPDGGLVSPLAKVASDDLRDVLSNYDDVAQYLSGTPFEKFLD